MKRKATEEGDDLRAIKRQMTEECDSGIPDDDVDGTTTASSDDLSSTAKPEETVLTTTSGKSRVGHKFPSDIKNIGCTVCSKTFNRPARLVAHMRSHSNDRPFKCDHPGCDKDYMDQKHLKQHVQATHEHIRKYACTVEGCDKAFLTGTRLRRHAAVHEGAERYRCRGYENCAKSFRKHATLQRHIRSDHLGLPKFTCGKDGCEQGFDTAGSLKRHVAREHAELRYWCDECEVRGEDTGEVLRKVGFRSMTMLQAHARREHVNCMFCNIKCKTQRDLQQHLDVYHAGKTVEERKTHACEWPGCPKKFTRVSARNAHRKTAHEGKRWVCGEVDTFDVKELEFWNWMEEGCGASFISRLKLEEHARFVHLGKRRPGTTYPAPREENLVNRLVASDRDNRTLLCSVVGCAARFVRYHELNLHLLQHELAEFKEVQEDNEVGKEPPGEGQAPAPPRQQWEPTQSEEQGFINPSQFEVESGFDLPLDPLLSSGDALKLQSADSPDASL